MTNIKAKHFVEVVILLLVVSIVLVVATILTLLPQFDQDHGYHQSSQALCQQDEVRLAAPPPVTLSENAASRGGRKVIWQ